MRPSQLDAEAEVEMLSEAGLDCRVIEELYDGAAMPHLISAAVVKKYALGLGLVVLSLFVYAFSAVTGPMNQPGAAEITWPPLPTPAPPATPPPATPPPPWLGWSRPGPRRRFVYLEGRGARVEWSSDESVLPCNLLFVKVPKCASSSAAGVARRIAAHSGLSGVYAGGWVTENGEEPGLWAHHGKLHVKIYLGQLNALEQPAFLFTMIRSPFARCMSAYYAFVESKVRNGTITPEFEGAWIFGDRDAAARWAAAHQSQSPDTAGAKLDYLRQSASCRNYLYRYLTPTSPGLLGPPPMALVRDEYSFIGLTERFDESVVMLAFLLRVPLSHVLYFRSKDSAAAHTADASVVPHRPVEEEPPEVRQFATSREFNVSNALDLELHDAASAELDRRWAANKGELDAALASFRAMLVNATRTCELQGESYARAKATGHEGGRGTAGWCYWSDHGCGYRCLDENFES